MSAPAMTSGRIVALGGGHGLYATLSAARLIGDCVSAIVTVADDGGSSGRLRRELGIVPPGDLRMALCALAGRSADHQLLTELFQHRFGGSGALAGHAVGNLVFAGLVELSADPVDALAVCARILGVQGQVLPMCSLPIEIEARVTGLERDDAAERTIRGQVAIATTPGTVRSVRLVPECPPAVPQALDAIKEADLVILGPGSWFTSVLPNLLVPDIADALKKSSAQKVCILNLAPQPGETAGFSASHHLEVLIEHAPGLQIDVVVVDSRSRLSPGELRSLQLTAEKMGAVVLDHPVAGIDPNGELLEVHDAQSLATALLAATPRP